MVWVDECLRVRSCLYARVFVHELLYAYSTCVLTIFGVCACMCLDYLFENLPIYSSMEEMYGSYSSATSSQAGQFVLCKKNNSLNISLFSPQDCLRQSFTILTHFYYSGVLEGDVVLQTKKSLKQLI